MLSGPAAVERSALRIAHDPQVPVGMTKEHWEAGTDPLPMLEELFPIRGEDSREPPGRESRRYFVACARRAWGARPTGARGRPGARAAGVRPHADPRRRPAGRRLSRRGGAGALPRERPARPRVLGRGPRARQAVSAARAATEGGSYGSCGRGRPPWRPGRPTPNDITHTNPSPPRRRHFRDRPHSEPDRPTLPAAGNNPAPHRRLPAPAS